MSRLCYGSLCKIWPVISEAVWKSTPQKLLLERKSEHRVICHWFCKKYGLYDEDEDALPEYNRRGAYIEKQRTGWRPRNSSWDSDDYIDGDYGSRNHPNSYTRMQGENMDQNFRDNEYFQRPASYRQYRNPDEGFQNRRQQPGYRGNPRGSYSGYRTSRPFGDSNYNIPPRYDNLTDQDDLPAPNFSNLPPVKKDLYVEHADVAARSMEDIEEYRKTQGMTVKGIDVPKPIAKFSELNIPESLLRVIKEQNFPNPTPIQAQGWPVALSGRDMIGISQTGSGKTLVFIVPAVVHTLNQTPPKDLPRYACSPQALVLAPTRELVQQIHGISSMFRHSCGIRSSCAYGGASKLVQLSKMRDAHICIATPGRLIDFLMEGSLSLNSCTYLVLDEADRMLDMGFEPQIRKIISRIRPDRQTLMWSATWPEEVQSLAEDFLTNYVHVTIGSDELTANPNIEQNIYVIGEFDKRNRLLSLLGALRNKGDVKVLIFAQTKRSVDYLADLLNREGILAMAIHGDISQARRDRVIRKFREDRRAILVATDVAARGLDVDDISHVINFDFPPTIEDYIHRIGRTARGTKTGVSHSFFTPQNAGLVRDLINVLEEAGQPVTPDLVSLVGRRHGQRPRPSSYRSTSRGWN